MSTQQQKSGGPSTIVGIVIGVVMMVGGFWFAQNFHLKFVDNLAKQGIPLDPGRTISTIGVFLILFPVIKFFFLNPLSEAVGSRTIELEKTFSEAEDLRSQMQSMQTAYERRLAETEADAREKIQTQIKEAQSLRTRLESEAVGRADELVRRAREEIESDRTRLMLQLRTEVVNLTLSATEKLLGENMDTDRNRKLVEEFINKVEVPS